MAARRAFLQHRFEIAVKSRLLGERSDIGGDVLGIAAGGRQIHPWVRRQYRKRNRFRRATKLSGDRLKRWRVCQFSTRAWLDNVTWRTVLLRQTFSAVLVCSNRALCAKYRSKCRGKEHDMVSQVHARRHSRFVSRDLRSTTRQSFRKTSHCRAGPWPVVPVPVVPVPLGAAPLALALVVPVRRAIRRLLRASCRAIARSLRALRRAIRRLVRSARRSRRRSLPVRGS